MVCSGCGASFLDEHKFCPYCGKSKPVDAAPAEIKITLSTENVIYEFCTLGIAYEKEKTKGLFGWVRDANRSNEWIIVVAKHQSTGKEIMRAEHAANHYLYWHGDQKQSEKIKQIIENGKTEVWQFLESDGWEFYNSQPGDKMPTYFFRKKLASIK